MAGKMNGLAPSAFTWSTAAFGDHVDVDDAAAPDRQGHGLAGLDRQREAPERLPHRGGHVLHAGPRNFCLTRAMRGKVDARGMPVSFIAAET